MAKRGSKTRLSWLLFFLTMTLAFFSAIFITNPIMLRPNVELPAPLWPWAPRLIAFLTLGMPPITALLTRSWIGLPVLLGAWLLGIEAQSLTVPGRSILETASGPLNWWFWYHSLLPFWVSIAASFALGKTVRFLARLFRRRPPIP